jgi:hypothetical protein
VVYASSAMTELLSHKILSGRPYGGVAILVSNVFANQVRIIQIDERFIILSVGDILLCNVYLPCKSTMFSTEVFIDTVEVIADTVRNTNSKVIIIGGDFNVNLNSNSSMAEVIFDMCADLKLLRTDQLMAANDKVTYRNSNETASSLIDYFLVSGNIIDDVLAVRTVDNGANFSDHIPLFMAFNYLNLMGNTPTAYDVNAALPCEVDGNLNKPILAHSWRWDKANLQNYYNLTFQYLNEINCGEILNNSVSRVMIVNEIEQLLGLITDALQRAADNAVPRKRTNFFKHWWDNELDDCKAKSIKDHKQWISFGRPRSGPLYDNMVKSKSEYKLLIKTKEVIGNNQFSDELGDALRDKNSVQFWKSWNAKFNRTQTKAQVVAGCKNDNDIASKFADFFEAAARVNTVHRDVEFRNKFNDRMKNYVGDTGLYVVDEGCIYRCISNMKKGKAAGFDGLMVEHLIYSHPSIIQLLCVIFNLCLAVGYTPESFTRGIVIPLLKANNVDKSKLENYRGITLSCVFSKVFELCLQSIFMSFFNTDDLQFGFKKNTSCNDAILTAKAAINYYTTNGSTVTACVLDLSKAFDKVNGFGLFLKLMDRSVPVVLIRILESWYGRYVVCVRWGSALSEPIRLCAGVRQGGVLSPVLFAIYVNGIIETLKKSRCGLTVRNNFLGCILYADDILLLANSLCTMQKMLDICSKIVNDLDLSFNVNKSGVLRFGKRFNNDCASLVLDGQILKACDKVKYLGVTIKSGATLVFDLGNTCACFYRAFNSLLKKCSFTRSEMICSYLLRSFCVPIITYAFEVLSLSTTMFAKLNNLIDNAVRKIFNLRDAANVQFVRCMVGLKDLTIVRKLRAGFYLFNLTKKSFQFKDVIFRHAISCDSWFTGVVRHWSVATDVGVLGREILTATRLL